MKQNLLTTIAAAAIIASAPSCKTTEENYRTAYEITKAKKNEGLTGEEISGFAREEAIPRTLYKGDSISLKAEYLTRVEGEHPAASGVNATMWSWRHSSSFLTPAQC